jgi:hypothetical protein
MFSGESKRLEIVLAVVGGIVTVALGVSQWHLGQRQNQILADQTAVQERLAVDQIEIQTMNLVSNHLDALLENGPRGEKAEAVVLAAAEFLSAEHQRTSLAEIAAKLIKQRAEPDPALEGRFVEAIQPAKKEADWFTVIGSYGTSMLDAAITEANRQQRELAKVLPQAQVEIYKTKHSNHFAVVLGGKQTKEEAEELALRARSESWAAGAYGQPDREWTLFGAAPF